jgi:hypothetical protein
MKKKPAFLIVLMFVIVAIAIFVVRAQSRRGAESELPQVMRNYQKTFKLDTSPAIFPDGRSTNLSGKTNAPNP